MPSVYFQTFGCQMNSADSDTIHELLSRRGFVLTDSCGGSDLIVVNTCSVREAAEKRAKGKIAEFARGKKSRPGQKLWVVGCMAERLGDSLKEQIPGVDLVVGAKQMERIDEVIEEQFPQSQYDTGASPMIFGKTAVTDFVPVMRGCDNYCAYCVVPYVRGREQSVPYDIIESTVKEKIAAGIKEITFLGQNVNSYNHGGIDFPALLSKMSNIDGLERIRFTTSHPKDCTEKLIDVMASSKKFASHIHLPVQAGADRILSLMNRKYTSSHYRNLLDMIRTRIPHADITSDILVGFPTETDAEFRETLSLVRAARFTTAFMFAYSPREGTAAASMKEEISKEEKNARLTELIALQTEITREIYENSVGRELEVLITGRQEKRDKAWMGQDAGCKKVLISCEPAEPGMILNVKATRSSGMTLIV
ncbi:MAG: tRNA (N6-isopentenyl adenosine(37)-C2)-methylthiotransferase MiaB [Chitinispirillales bacterium]|jgi:tRNA-2-methylthio-N6-dimethylallyladenosine synthase|nr:tRNA (N6-isopentenyl adenosine(37)-C2)-methylthiotransferase MiaB [Chitinispirillales bacterium]